MSIVWGLANYILQYLYHFAVNYIYIYIYRPVVATVYTNPSLQINIYSSIIILAQEVVSGILARVKLCLLTYIGILSHKYVLANVLTH